MGECHRRWLSSREAGGREDGIAWQRAQQMHECLFQTARFSGEDWDLDYDRQEEEEEKLSLWENTSSRTNDQRRIDVETYERKKNRLQAIDVW